MLRNMLGPVFNLYLDQCLTSVFLFLAETPNFIVFSAKHAKFKEAQKEQKTLCVNTAVLTALVKMSVFLHFSFLLFLEFPFFRDVF